MTKNSRLTYIASRLPPAAYLLALLSLALLGGCVPTEQKALPGPMAEVGHDSVNTARLSCFLTLKDLEGPAIRLEVVSIEAQNDGSWVPLFGGQLQIDSTAIGNGQLFLCGRAVPPGLYHRLRLTMSRGEVKKADGKYAVVADEPFQVEGDLTAPVSLKAGDSRSLLISWDTRNSLQAGDTLQPVLVVAPSLRQLLLNLVFVACPDIDTVFVVRADKDWVVDSFGLPGRPTYLAVDPDPSRQLLYVLTSQDRMVKVVDLSSFRVVDFFTVPLNDTPTFMVINPDGNGAYLLDENNGYLSRMDLTTGQSLARVSLGYRPTYVAYLGGHNLLAVSLSLSQKVLLLDPMTLAATGSISTDSSPQGVMVFDNKLYVAEYGGNSVSITDLTHRGNQSRLTVGFGPRRLLATDDQIYVSNYRDGSLSVLVPDQLGVIEEIYGLGRPLEMAFDQFYRRLYVADEDTAALAVLDVNSNLLLGRITLGAKPLGLAVIQ